MAEANAVRPQPSKSAAFSIPDMVIDRHLFAALQSLLLADFVAEVGGDTRVAVVANFLK